VAAIVVAAVTRPFESTVKTGILVDNTTGSAILEAQDMFGVLTQNIDVTGSIGERLKNVSTIQTVAATLSSFKV